MDRKDFLCTLMLGSGSFISNKSYERLGGVIDHEYFYDQVGYTTFALVVGGGLGGFASALALLRNGKSVILTEETDWIGGQLTSQGVPPDEHPWIETHGAPLSYMEYRKRVRAYYKSNYPVIPEQRDNPYFNPGSGSVSRICHEPKVGVSVLEAMLSPYVSNGQLTVLLCHKAISAKVSQNDVLSVLFEDLTNQKKVRIEAKYFVDATELGDLLPMTNTEFIVGSESKSQTKELHALEIEDVDNQQAFTTCFALEYIEGEDFAQKPNDYDFWSKYVPSITPAWSGKLLDLTYSDPRTLLPKKLGFNPTGENTQGALNLWNYRKIINRNNFDLGFYKSDISLVNWPQNDYLLGTLIGKSSRDFKQHLKASKELGLSLLYWLQTEAPRDNGKKGWPGLRICSDIMGTHDGFAKYPYIRESRRIKAEFTITEEHIGKENRALMANRIDKVTNSTFFGDSVGIGYYPIDLHPTMKRNYVDFPSFPFQIPLGALLPVKMDNLLPANKNIGTTHITNGAYRLHPIEWSIGEAVGLLISYANDLRVRPREIRRDKVLLENFQAFIRQQGLETEWPI